MFSRQLFSITFGSIRCLTGEAKLKSLNLLKTLKWKRFDDVPNVKKNCASLEGVRMRHQTIEAPGWWRWVLVSVRWDYLSDREWSVSARAEQRYDLWIFWTIFAQWFYINSWDTVGLSLTLVLRVALFFVNSVICLCTCQYCKANVVIRDVCLNITVLWIDLAREETTWYLSGVDFSSLCSWHSCIAGVVSYLWSWCTIL